MIEITVSARGAARWQRGHPWIYRDALVRNDDLESGQVVDVLTRDGRRLARGQVGVGHDHAELFPAVPRDHIHRARGPLQHFGQLSQHGIARRVAMFVVKLFETIDIQQ